MLAGALGGLGGSWERGVPEGSFEVLERGGVAVSIAWE